MPRNYHPDFEDLDYAVKRLRSTTEKEFNWARVQVLVWELKIVLDHLEGKEHVKEDSSNPGPRAA